MSDHENGGRVPQDVAHDEVVNILAKYLADAKAGRFRYVGIVLVDGAGDGVSFAIEHGGAQSLQFPAAFGVDLLKTKIQTDFLQRTQRSGVMPIRPTLIK